MNKADNKMDEQYSFRTVICQYSIKIMDEQSSLVGQLLNSTVLQGDKRFMLHAPRANVRCRPHTTRLLQQDAAAGGCYWQHYNRRDKAGQKKRRREAGEKEMSSDETARQELVRYGQRQKRDGGDRVGRLAVRSSKHK